MEIGVDFSNFCYSPNQENFICVVVFFFCNTKNNPGLSLAHPKSPSGPWAKLYVPLWFVSCLVDKLRNQSTSSQNWSIDLLQVFIWSNKIKRFRWQARVKMPFAVALRFPITGKSFSSIRSSSPEFEEVRFTPPHFKTLVLFVSYIYFFYSNYSIQLS